MGVLLPPFGARADSTSTRPAVSWSGESTIALSCGSGAKWLRRMPARGACTRRYEAGEYGHGGALASAARAAGRKQRAAAGCLQRLRQHHTAAEFTGAVQY